MRADEAPIEAPDGSDSFDLIVLGTGLVEALVAGAAAKAGKSVLHVDHEEHYGGQWASFGLPALRRWLADGDAAVAAADADDATQPPGTPNEAPVRAAAAARRRFGAFSFAGPDAAPDAPPAATRGCSLDLAGPKVAYCSGELVGALLRSGAHAYVEFKAVEALATHARGALRRQPGSRSEVFTSRDLSAADKRALMRALKTVADAANAEGSEPAALPPPFDDGSASFTAALGTAGLSPELRASALHALALCDADVTCAEGVAALQRYMASLGRYGAPGAFLVPLYGASELPQAFCRTAAVAGAVYVLRRDVASLLLDGEGAARRVVGVRTAAGQALRCGALAAGGAYLAALRPGGEAPRAAVRRCVAVTDAPLPLAGAPPDAPTHHQLLAVLPPGCLGAGPPAPVRLLQFGPAACVTPDNRWLLHLSTPAALDDAAAHDAEAALSPALRALVNCDNSGADDVTPGRPALRFAVFFSASDDSGEAASAAAWLPSNAALCAGPGGGADVAAAVRCAEAAFARLFPDLPFFAPPPPDAADAAGAVSDEDEADAELLAQVAALDAGGTAKTALEATSS